MVEIKKRKSEVGTYDIEIISDNGKLNILFGGNGDLYFFVPKIDYKNKNEIINFEITKENYELFTLFETLYNEVINCDVFRIDEDELDYYAEEEIEEKRQRHKEWNSELKTGYVYNNLVHDGVISWKHDDQIEEEANILNIYKENDKYRLEFVLRNTEMSFFIDVRFRNSGSRYQPFNISFMRFFNKLQQYDTEYHQIHIEEYMYQKQYQKKHS